MYFSLSTSTAPTYLPESLTRDFFEHVIILLKTKIPVHIYSVLCVRLYLKVFFAFYIFNIFAFIVM